MLPPVDRRLPRSSMRARTTNERNERVTGTATDSPNFKHKISPINTPTPNSRPLHRSTLLRQEQFRMRKKKSNGWCNCRTFGSATASLRPKWHTHMLRCVLFGGRGAQCRASLAARPESAATDAAAMPECCPAGCITIMLRWSARLRRNCYRYAGRTVWRHLQVEKGQAT